MHCPADDHALVYWPDEDSMSVIPLSSIADPPAAVGEGCQVRIGREMFKAVTMKIGMCALLLLLLLLSLILLLTPTSYILLLILLLLLLYHDHSASSSYYYHYYHHYCYMYYYYHHIDSYLSMNLYPSHYIATETHLIL